MTSREVCRRTGITYRVLDRWVRLDVIAPNGVKRTGSGNHREWTVSQTELISAMWKVHQAFVDTGVTNLGPNCALMRKVRERLEVGEAWYLNIVAYPDLTVRVSMP